MLKIKQLQCDIYELNLQIDKLKQDKKSLNDEISALYNYIKSLKCRKYRVRVEYPYAPYDIDITPVYAVETTGLVFHKGEIKTEWKVGARFTTKAKAEACIRNLKASDKLTDD